MKLGGDRLFRAPRQDVWNVLTRPEALARTVPGVESFEQRDPEHWTAKVKIPLGLVHLRLAVDFALVEHDEPRHAVLGAEGRGPGGSLEMETSFALDERGDDETAMHWEATVTLSGRGAALGGRLLRPLVDRQVARVLDTIDSELRAPAGG